MIPVAEHKVKIARAEATRFFDRSLRQGLMSDTTRSSKSLDVLRGDAGSSADCGDRFVAAFSPSLPPRQAR